MSTKSKARQIDMSDPATLHALVAALPEGKHADRAWAEYAALCRLYTHFAVILSLIGVDAARIPALAQADDVVFGHEIATTYRENIESQGYLWVAEVATVRRLAAHVDGSAIGVGEEGRGSG